eukprot:scaffold13128_cov76-Phaeocystis_antarctica.AAC.2
MASPPPPCQPRAHVTFQRGDGWKFRDSSTLDNAYSRSCGVLIYVRTPPPCEAREQGQPPLGRWMKAQGTFKRQAHQSSLIGVHVGVGQRCRTIDAESPAILPNISTRNVPAGRWMKVQGRFNPSKLATPLTPLGAT